MIQYSNININRENHGYQRIIVMLMFIVGLLNSNIYFDFMGLNTFTSVLSILFYGLLGFMCFIVILSYFYKKNLSIFQQFPYLLILFIAVLFKSFILFIQLPSSILPGGSNFDLLITILINLFLIIVLIRNVYSMYYIKASVWSFGIGASFSAIIPFLYYPEMIGQRTSLINDYVFTGAFWNAGVISYISVGWLLIALSTNEKSKTKKIVLISIFVLIASAGLSGLSRGTLMSLIISVIVYLVMSNNFIKYIKVIVFTSILLVVSFFVFQDTVENFAERIDNQNIKDESRIVIWKDYIEDISDYFILGEIEGNHTKYSITGHAPHSVLLNWFTQFGVFALIGFCMLLLGVLKSINDIRLFQSKQAAAALYAWLAAYLSIGLINETGFKQLAVFGGIGIILAWGNIVNMQKSNIK